MAGVARHWGWNVRGRLGFGSAPVAGQATIRYGIGVIKLCARPRAGVVAGVTGGGDPSVGRVVGFLTCVALQAAALRKHGMIDSCRDPRGGAVAGITGGIGLHVVGRLAGCHAAIMALQATSGCHAGVAVSCSGPGHGIRMTLIAGQSRGDMVGGLEALGHAAALNMATFALGGCPLEYALHVAGLALDPRMRAP